MFIKYNSLQSIMLLAERKKQNKTKKVPCHVYMYSLGVGNLDASVNIIVNTVKLRKLSEDLWKSRKAS